jgi:hypothetical protein
MADVKTFKKGIKIKPEASAPNSASSNEGQLYFKTSDGLYYSDGSSWNKVSVTGTTQLANHTIGATDTTYTAGTNSEDIILCAPNAGVNLVITLPAVASSGSKVFTIVRTSTTTGTVTIDGNASETINGQTSIKLDKANQNVEVYCSGSNWTILGEEEVDVFDLTISNANPSTSLSNIAYYTANKSLILTEVIVGTLDIPSGVTGTLELDLKKGTNRGNATSSILSTNASINITGASEANTDSTNAALSTTYINKGDVLKIELPTIPSGLSKYYIKVKGVR